MFVQYGRVTKFCPHICIILYFDCKVKKKNVNNASLIKWF